MINTAGESEVDLRNFKERDI